MTAAARPALPPEADRLTRMTACDFRNFTRIELAFPEGGVVIVGDNGQGKTNLLEAIAYLGSLRSIRNARDRDLVRHGASHFSLRGAVSAAGPTEIVVGVERATGRKRISIDGVEAARQTDALGVLPSVGWAPADVTLVAGSPAERRRYLDVMLALRFPSYLSALRDYRAALERRNAAIRAALTAGRDSSAVSVWERPLAERGAVLVATRREWVDEHGDGFSRLCAAMGERLETTLRYAGDAAAASDAEAALRDQLARERDRDLRRGQTSAGPHRDDLAIAIAGHDARTFGSAGQQRTAAIALRLLEARTLRARNGRQPVLLLDDPFAELDRTRTARALELLAADAPGQVVLAVPREEEIPDEFRLLPRWRMLAGEVEQ